MREWTGARAQWALCAVAAPIANVSSQTAVDHMNSLTIYVCIYNSIPLRPHRSLANHYLDAYSMGRHGINCRQAFPTAVHCVLDDYVHVHERGLTQSYV